MSRSHIQNTIYGQLHQTRNIPSRQHSSAKSIYLGMDVAVVRVNRTRQGRDIMTGNVMLLDAKEG